MLEEIERDLSRKNVVLTGQTSYNIIYSQRMREIEGKISMKSMMVRCILGISMIAVLLNGCVKEDVTKRSEEINETVTEQVTESESEQENKYEKFLNDEEVLFFHKYNHYDYIDDIKYFEEEKGYTLSEIVRILVEKYYEFSDTTEMDSISYAYIDCGMDGVEELAISFNGMDIYCQNDDSTLVYIIKDIDNHLELCYYYETWARSSAFINEYGYFVSSGSSGATRHGAEYGLIDKNGDWKFILGEEEELDILFVNYPEELSRVGNVAAVKAYEGNIAFYTISLGDENVYSFEVFDDNYENITEPYMYTDSVYKEIFDEAGVTVLPREEIEQMIAGKEKQVGLTEEIRNGQQIEWTIMEDAICEEHSNQEKIKKHVIEYGDSITVSCEITQQPIVWEEAGEAVFQVATTTEQFRNEFDLSEETTMKKVEEAIGKTVGESFVLWFEGGDGLYGYEYIIQEIVDKSDDKVAYGDKVHTTYSMKADGVDRGDEIVTGEQVIHVIHTDKFLASEEIGYSVSAGEKRVNDIVGKGVGETFQMTQEAPEWTESYTYTIQKIDKAVEYGDTIRATVRRAGILADSSQVVHSGEPIEMELLTPNGTINLLGNTLNMTDTMRFLKEMQGKGIGDKIYFSTMTGSDKKMYQITVLEVYSKATEEIEYEIEPLMLSEEENAVYFYDDNENAPIYYAIVTDAEKNMVYEYIRGFEGEYWLETSKTFEVSNRQ